MSLTRIQKLRRQEFADAAIEVFAEHGMADTTFELVAKQAGVPKSNVLHYFENKPVLIEAAYRRYLVTYSGEINELLKRAKTPWDRIYAVIEANFSKTTFRPSVTRAHAYLCAEAHRNAALDRIHRIMTKRMHNNLMFALAQVTDTTHANLVAQSLSLTIRGLWLGCVTQSNGIERGDAIGQCEFLLSALFPDNEERIESKKRMAEISSILFDYE